MSMIASEDHDGVALLRLRHGKANALDVELCRELAERFRNLSEGAARAVVLTGQGTIFSAGVDLLRLTAGGPGYVRTFLQELQGLCETVFSFPKPLVAAVNGHAIAGGFILACMADRRIMARGSGRVGLPELLVGVPFPPGPMEVLRFALPSTHLPRMMYSGATHEADPALDRCLVDEVVEPGELLPHALRSAAALGALGDDTFRLTKAQIRQPALARMRERQRDIGPEIERVWAAPETLARIAAYVKRTFKPGAP
jgi:enoyl-CoA hydratase/carnithine racemase